MIILELGDVLGFNLVASKLYTILFAINRTYFTECFDYAFANVGRAANLS